MRLIDADKYMSHLRANINTTSDIIAKQIKKDKPIGTVADGGQIGYLNALQWARASLECDCYTVQAIPIPDNATNYDVLKVVFGNTSAFRIKDTMEFEKGFELWFSKPYKRGDLDGSN